jgi:KUP system potassium uptake protein
LLGAALIYGDGAITPAISVLSALEGVNVVTTSFKPYVMPMAVLILIALFLAQRVGTEKIGRAFGPVMLLWFMPSSRCSAHRRNRAHIPRCSRRSIRGTRCDFCAFGRHGFAGARRRVLVHHRRRGALRRHGTFRQGADSLVLVCDRAAGAATELCGADRVSDGAGHGHRQSVLPMAPAWSIYPLVALATVATIIASQAIITGSFSMTRQAVQLGWLPGVAIRQTSDAIYGQIYVPIVNWLMMIATVGITIGFGSSDRLAGAYGTAVATTMLLTTGLLYVAMRRVWRWPLAIVLPVAGCSYSSMRASSPRIC